MTNRDKWRIGLVLVGFVGGLVGSYIGINTAEKVVNRRWQYRIIDRGLAVWHPTKEGELQWVHKPAGDVTISYHTDGFEQEYKHAWVDSEEPDVPDPQVPEEAEDE